jgi:hypothetical protein
MDRNKLIKLAKLVMKFAEVETDKGTLIIDGDLAVGVEVSVEVEGEYKPAEDGEYTTETQKITIKDGKVESIEAIEVEEEVTEEPKEEVTEEPIALSKLEVKQQEFSQSYEETERKLAEAIGWCWVIEAGDGWCIVGKYNEDDWSERYYRYSYTLDENEDVVLGDFVEVFRRYVSEEEIAQLEKDTTEEIVNLQSQIKELEEKLNQPIEQGIKMSATVKEKTIEKSGALKYFEK